MSDRYVRERLRTVRVPDSLWNPARDIARQRGESVSQVIRATLTRYIEKHGDRSNETP